MRYIYTLIFTFFLSLLLSGQSLVLTPEEVVQHINLEEFENVGYAKLKNTSNQTMTVVWRREVIRTNNNWEISICDKNSCYLPFIETRELILGPGEESNLDVHIRHNGYKDNGEVKMIAYDKSNSSETVSGSFIFTTSGSTSTQKVVFGDQLKIWPNPAQQFFTVNESKILSKIEVLNLLGNVVKVYDTRSSTQFDISDLTSGIYLIRMISKNDASKSKTIRLRKS